MDLRSERTSGRARVEPLDDDGGRARVRDDERLSSSKKKKRLSLSLFFFFSENARAKDPDSRACLSEGHHCEDIHVVCVLGLKKTTA